MADWGRGREEAYDERGSFLIDSLWFVNSVVFKKAVQIGRWTLFLSHEQAKNFVCLFFYFLPNMRKIYEMPY